MSTQSPHTPSQSCRACRRAAAPALALLATLATGAATALVAPTVAVAQVGATAASPVPRFAKFEAAFTFPDQAGNPFDPRDNAIDVTFAGPKGLRAVVPAFWDGDRWRVRYAPSTPGAYTLTVTRNGKMARPTDLTAVRFRCVPSRDPGFVRRSASVVQKFVFDDGQPYYPLGMDVAWQNGGDADYPVYFADMGQAHLNWARVWTTYWDGKNLEWAPDRADDPKIGTYLLSAARRWDMVMGEAARNGVYVQMVLQHHGPYTTRTDPNWQDNPFNAANGGFLQKPDDFFTDPEARRLTRAKYRYTVARWGYATHLLSFELFNEVQNIREADSHFQDVVNWHKEMAAYLRSIDPYHHLITTSNSDPGNALSDIGLDYNQIHTYPPDIVSTFAGVRTAGLTVPEFYGEWGPQNVPPGSGPAVAEGLVRDGVWAGLMTPTAGASQYWFWDSVMKNHWWPVFASAGGFAQAFHVAGLGPMRSVQPAVDAPGARADLAFAPGGGWAPTTRFDVTLTSDGAAPDLSGVSSYIQGTGNRTLMPRPITFHLNAASPCRFEVQAGTVSPNGAHPTLALDGGTPQEQDFPPGAPNGNRAIGLDVPAGAHTVTLFNTGPDWFIARRISVTGYVPAVAVLAKGNARQAEFWAYKRDRSDTAAGSATLHFADLAPGRYRVRLWDVAQGIPRGVTVAVAPKTGEGLAVPLPNMTGDIAGVVVPATAGAQ